MVCAAYTITRPSGETAVPEPVVRWTGASTGTGIENSIWAGADATDGRVPNHIHVTREATVAKPITTALRVMSARFGARRGGRAITAVEEVGGFPLSEAIQWSSEATSRAVCQRSSRSFARQRAMTRSKGAGTSGTNDRTGAGWSLRIAPIRLACVLPVNACRPVTISYS